MSQLIPSDEIKFDKNVNLEDMFSFVEVDSKYRDEISEKRKNFPFCPENKISPKDKFSRHMKKICQRYTDLEINM